MFSNTTCGNTATPTTSRRQSSERRRPLTIETVLSIVAVLISAFSVISSTMRNGKKDTEGEAEDRASTHTMLITKLENISDDLKDIKRDYRDTCIEVQNLRERVVAVEASLKSYHKRLDGKTEQ